MSNTPVLSSAPFLNLKNDFYSITQLSIELTEGGTKYLYQPSLIDSARKDGSLYATVKVRQFHKEQISQPFIQDSVTARDVLQVYRSETKEQIKRMKEGRQFAVTIDSVLTKTAFNTEGAFAYFISQILEVQNGSKRVEDAKRYNAFVGTHFAARDGQDIIKAVTPIASGENVTATEINQSYQLRIKDMAKAIKNILNDVEDCTADYNDCGYLGGYRPEDSIMVIEDDLYDDIMVELANLYHTDKVTDSLFNGRIHRLHKKYFGRPLAAGDKGSGKVIKADDTYDPTKGTIRVYDVKQVTISNTVYNLRGGDEIPAGATVKAGGDFELDEVYLEDHTYQIKITYEELPEYSENFDIKSLFNNTRNHSQNHYLTYNYMELTHWINLPWLSVGFVDRA